MKVKTCFLIGHNFITYSFSSLSPTVLYLLINAFLTYGIVKLRVKCMTEMHNISKVFLLESVAQ